MALSFMASWFFWILLEMQPWRLDRAKVLDSKVPQDLTSFDCISVDYRFLMNDTSHEGKCRSKVKRSNSYPRAPSDSLFLSFDICFDWEGALVRSHIQDLINALHLPDERKEKKVKRTMKRKMQKHDSRLVFSFTAWERYKTWKRLKMKTHSQAVRESDPISNCFSMKGVMHER